MVSKVVIGGGVVGIILVIVLIYSLMTGVSFSDPQVGTINVPNWFVWLHFSKNPDHRQLPEMAQKFAIVLAYSGRGQ